MRQLQRYVSSELSHFVGRGKPEEEQYYTLVEKILKTGWLTHFPHDPSAPRSSHLDLGKPISTDEAIKSQAVCFCDIPEPDLAIRVSKYSKFGLGFKKEFLVERGACPVFYVAKEGRVNAPQLFDPPEFSSRIRAAQAARSVDRALYFDTNVRALFEILAAVEALCADEHERFFRGTADRQVNESLGKLLGLTEAQIGSAAGNLKGNEMAGKTVTMCARFLMDDVFSYIKMFDAKYDPEDITNYYMEREWRIAGNLQFELDDVHRIFLPSSYSRKFRADLPTYSAQLSFVD